MRTKLGLITALVLLCSVTSACANEIKVPPSPTYVYDTPVDPYNDYELWVTDQANNLVHIISSDLVLIDSIDFGTLGLINPHWIDFTSDYQYGFIANTKSGNVGIVRTSDRKVVQILETGPSTHAANVYPDDKGVLVSVIGEGSLVEILVDLEQELFTIGRRLILSQDPTLLSKATEFGATNPLESPKAVPITATFTQDSSYAYVPIKPGGLLVINMNTFQVEKAFPMNIVNTNLMGLLSLDDTKIYVNGGSLDGTNQVYMFDTTTHEVLAYESTNGLDAHGLDLTPDGKELWITNRNSSSISIIDTESMKVKENISLIGTAPDLLGISPDGVYAFITLSGSKAPNAGTMPGQKDLSGISVLDVQNRELFKILLQSEGNNSVPQDFHGLKIRLLK